MQSIKIRHCPREIRSFGIPTVRHRYINIYILCIAMSIPVQTGTDQFESFVFGDLRRCGEILGFNIEGFIPKMID